MTFTYTSQAARGLILVINPQTLRDRWLKVIHGMSFSAFCPRSSWRESIIDVASSAGNCGDWDPKNYRESHAKTRLVDPGWSLRRPSVKPLLHRCKLWKTTTMSLIDKLVISMFKFNPMARTGPSERTSEALFWRMVQHSTSATATFRSTSNRSCRFVIVLLFVFYCCWCTFRSCFYINRSCSRASRFSHLSWEQNWDVCFYACRKLYWLYRGSVLLIWPKFITIVMTNKEIIQKVNDCKNLTIVDSNVLLKRT